MADPIPTIADLALQYGTIDQDQFRHITLLYRLAQEKKQVQDFSSLLLGQKFATQYQVDLLKLIRDFHIIRKNGKKFGRIAVEKGFASREDVQRAMAHQRKEFMRVRVTKLIGDILVESRVITEKQKNSILEEQSALAEQTDQILNRDPRKDFISLSAYEKQFLKIRALDQEFAARVIEKGFAAKPDVLAAQKIQDQAFDQKQPIRMVGSIMVEMGVLTPDQQKIVLNEQNRSLETDDPEKKTFSGHLNLKVSPDQMEARLIIKPGKNPGEITLSDIKNFLKFQSVKNGVYPDPILQCHLENRDLEFTAAYQDFSEDLLSIKKTVFLAELQVPDNGRVKKGDKLSREEPGNPEYQKTDVFGNKKSQDCGRDFTFRPGPGTRMSRKSTGVVAAKTGIPSISIQRKLYIHPDLHLLEDMDQRYGMVPEPYANLSIAGVLTGAYPVTAGRLRAREIRGASIDAAGDVHADVGITDSVIRANGSISARYIHNCRIETFGDVRVENEIFDSSVLCSGRVDSKNCRVVSSNIFAKKGITLFGAGSEKSPACTIGAGSEHHLLAYQTFIQEKIMAITVEVQPLKEKIKDHERSSKKIFQKMSELKIFHDRAKRKKQILLSEYKNKKNSIPIEKQKNIVRLIKTFEKRMKQSISTIKELYSSKKKIDIKKLNLEEALIRAEKKNQSRILSLEQDILSSYEWARSQKNISEIKFSGKVFQGTVVRGIFSEKKLEQDMKKFSVMEMIGNTSRQEKGHKTEKYCIKIV